uniref:Proteasome assembly chaperone 2 n=1 Tax=Phallusia mammillata TaxID=59560 RepID=A0A6F9DQJ0_9ASCI|nr:proteasome assembly chaperone 2-like [Phallusia mammillata]
MFVPCFSDETWDFTNSTLVVPAISVGNVGQLACDLLIHNLNLQKIGYFCVELFLPLVANNPFYTSNKNENSLSLSTEVYHSSTQQITVIQLRSPLVKGKRQTFCEALTQWFKALHFKELITLSSLHAFERSDSQLLGQPFRYLQSSACDPEKFVEFGWSQLEQRNVGHGDRVLFMPGGGFTKQLYKMCSEENIPNVVLLTFCSEGDNIPEAVTLTQRLNQWKSFSSKLNSWNYPKSWSHLFGNEPPKEIF